ncbi:glutathione S-transferase N-terminal domain-containing protein [Luteimonas sp. BDR2-5]|uniref:glutathione S-transferase family protein n=1 Tax=Proluteimonas luteida TaxID=2878685 RepID=UPI001E5A7C2C|nr:glutathione S-transferase N-terminal domain-containing protein [Luteimonas sp. BDR2-5]MCD9029910.1 glutathione S-transferase N-terminal domain-containing protein [Luteimonas sp. BDR2-5]
MKLYTKPGACSLADHIALQWIGVPFTATIVDGTDIKQPDFLALNPAGAVPVLVDGDWVLTQNAAILNYLADTFPDAGLGGDGTPRGRAEVNRWLAFLNADVHPTFHPLFGTTKYLEDADAIDRTRKQAMKRLRGMFERLDAQLAGRDWLVGTRSIADPYLFVVLQWAKKLRLDLGGLDNLHTFDARMLADPGVQAALEAEGIL